MVKQIHKNNNSASSSSSSAASSFTVSSQQPFPAVAKNKQKFEDDVVRLCEKYSQPPLILESLQTAVQQPSTKRRDYSSDDTDTDSDWSCEENDVDDWGCRQSFTKDKLLFSHKEQKLKRWKERARVENNTTAVKSIRSCISSKPSDGDYYHDDSNNDDDDNDDDEEEEGDADDGDHQKKKGAGGKRKYDDYDNDDYKTGAFPSERDMMRVGIRYQILSCLQNSKNDKNHCGVYCALDRQAVVVDDTSNTKEKKTDADDHAIVVLKFKYRGWRLLEKPCREIRILQELQENNSIGNEGIGKLLGWHILPESQSVVAVLENYKNDPILKTCQTQPSIVKIFMQQLLETLKYVHEHHIIHRDIKLSNILWDQEKKRCVLIDFDCAIHHPYRQPGPNPLLKLYKQVRGTEGYMSPEMQILESTDSGSYASRYDHRLDIYSAGVIMGQLVFEVDDDKLDHHESNSKNSALGFRKRAKYLRNHPTLSKADQSTFSLLSQMLHPDILQRPHAEQALQHEYFTTTITTTATTTTTVVKVPTTVM